MLLGYAYDEITELNNEYKKNTYNKFSEVI